MQTVRIILSADKSLQQERLELSDLVENLNHSLESRNANILLLVWDGTESDKESFKDKISDTDLCLTIYYDTFDDSTQSELEMAYNSLCEGKNPKKIYVYFKEGNDVSEKLQEFRDSFPTKYGHFYCSFSNVDTLKADFLLQFMEYQSKNLGSNKLLEVSDGKVTIDGKEYVDLKNVPFAGNNEEYNLLLKSIKKTKKLLAITDEEDEEYTDYAAELQELNEKLSKMENSLWDTALMITRLSTTNCSERLKRAMDLFSAGDNKGAQAVLNEEEIEHDVEHNLRLIQLGEEGKKGLKINIEEYRLKIKTLDNDIITDNSKHIISLYQKAVSVARGNIDIYDYINLLWDFVDYLHYQNLYAMGEELYDECLSLVRNNAANNCEDEIYNLALCLNGIANFHRKAGEFKKAEKEYFESIEIRKKLVETNRNSYLPGLARCLEDIAVFKSDLGDHASGLKLIEEAVSYRKEFHELEKFTNSSEKYAHCLGSYSYILHDINRYNDAISVLTESIDILKKLSDRDCDNLDIKNSIATSLDNLSIIYKEMGKYDLAESVSLKSLELSKDLYERRPNAYGPHHACNLLNLGAIYHESKEFEKSIVYISDALSIFSEMDNINPGVYKGDMALCLLNRATSYKAYCDFVKSESDFTHAIEIYRVLATKDEEYYAKYLAVCLNNQSGLLSEKCEYDTAIKLLLESVEIYRKLSTNYPDAYKPELANALSSLGWNYNKTNQGLEAETVLVEAIELIESLNDEETYSLQLAELYLYLGRTYTHELNQSTEGINAFSKCIDYYNNIHGNNGVNVKFELGMAYGDLAVAYHKCHNMELAKTTYLKSIDFFESIENATLTEQSNLANAYNNLAWFYFEENDLVSAEPLAKKAVRMEELYCRALGQESQNIIEFRDTLQQILNSKCND